MAKLTKEHKELLRKPVFAHVATVMPDGTPQSTPVWVDTDGEAVLLDLPIVCEIRPGALRVLLPAPMPPAPNATRGGGIGT